MVSSFVFLLKVVTVHLDYCVNPIWYEIYFDFFLPPPSARQRQKCDDINECNMNNGNCVENSLCVNTPGSFYCGACIRGYVGNQEQGCSNRPGICPDGTVCDENAECIRWGHLICSLFSKKKHFCLKDNYVQSSFVVCFSFSLAPIITLIIIAVITAVITAVMALIISVF